MIKRYYLIAKKYFSLKVSDKKLLFHLFFSNLLRSVSLLLIPFVASKVVEFATIKDYKLTLICSIIFLLVSLVYVLFHHYNYVAYKNNSIFTHNKLQKLILNKVTLYDEDFTKTISTSYIVDTAFNDVGNLMKIPDRIFDSIGGLLNIIIALIILFSVNVYIGLLALVLNLIAIYALGFNIKKRDYYLSFQRKHQDDISSLMGQILDGDREIKAFNMEESLNNYLEKYKKVWRRNYFKTRKYNDNFYVIVPTILGFGKIGIYFILAFLILNGSYDVSILVLVIGYYENIQNEFTKLSDKLDEFSANSIRLGRVYKLLNYKTKNMLDFGDNNNDYIKGKVEFKNVSFMYEKQEILKNVLRYPHNLLLQ